ncbi:hypothetical protein V7068_03930 [Bacillus sp. JJ634]
METRKQARIHQKKERKKRFRLKLKKLLLRFLLGATSGLGYLIGSQALPNADSIFSFIKELFLIISNSRYKIKGVYVKWTLKPALYLDWNQKRSYRKSCQSMQRH